MSVFCDTPFCAHSDTVCYQANEDVLRRLLNQCGKDGKTPLHLASLADKPEIVISMLCYGNYELVLLVLKVNT